MKMSSDQNIRALIAGLADVDAAGRGRAADSAADWVEAIAADEGDLVCRLLEVATRIETEPVALEAYLHALAELAEWDKAPRDVIGRVVASRSWSESWAIEYIGQLRALA
jgi:hypothetical protein